MPSSHPLSSRCTAPTHPGAHASNLHTILCPAPHWILHSALESRPFYVLSTCPDVPLSFTLLHLPWEGAVALPQATSTTACSAPCIHAACLWAISYLSVFPVFWSGVINLICWLFIEWTNIQSFSPSERKTVCLYSLYLCPFFPLLTCPWHGTLAASVILWWRSTFHFLYTF